MRNFNQEIKQLVENSRCYGKHIKKDKELLGWINNNYPYNCSLYLKVYMIINNLKEPPKCPVCNKYILKGNFLKGFANHCNNKCASKDPKRQEKAKETCAKHYGKGITNPSQAQEIKDKKAKTFEKHYGKGITCNFIAPEQIKSYKKQMMDKFGVENPFYSKEVQEEIHNKIRNRTTEEKEKTKQKYKETIIKNYGSVDNFNQKRNKTYKETCLKRSNGKYINCFQFPEIINKIQKTKEKNGGNKSRYFYDNQYFDSSWELAFYIWHKDEGIPIKRNITKYFTYINEDDNKEHKYFYDFEVKGELIELKGGHLLKDNWLYDPYTDNIHLNKTYCMRDNNVTLLDDKDCSFFIAEIEAEYGKNYLNQFKVNKKSSSKNKMKEDKNV